LSIFKLITGQKQICQLRHPSSKITILVSINCGRGGGRRWFGCNGQSDLLESITPLKAFCFICLWFVLYCLWFIAPFSFFWNRSWRERESFLFPWVSSVFCEVEFLHSCTRFLK
jgi:hypothetical protein